MSEAAARRTAERLAEALGFEPMYGDAEFEGTVDTIAAALAAARAEATGGPHDAGELRAAATEAMQAAQDAASGERPAWDLIARRLAAALAAGAAPPGPAARGGAAAPGLPAEDEAALRAAGEAFLDGMGEPVPDDAVLELLRRYARGLDTAGVDESQWFADWASDLEAGRCDVETVLLAVFDRFGERNGNEDVAREFLRAAAPAPPAVVE